MLLPRPGTLAARWIRRLPGAFSSSSSSSSSSPPSAALRLASRSLTTSAARSAPPHPTDETNSSSSSPPAENGSSFGGLEFAVAAPLSSDKSTNILLRTYKPRTPGVRHLKRPINDHLWKGRPFLPLTFPKKGHGKGGRNNTGQITVRHHGGGHKRRIRTVDFERWEPGPQLVERIEHDPGRSAHIALLTNQISGKKSYIVAAEGMRAGDIVESYRAGIPKELLDLMGGIVDPGILASRTAHRGNCLPLHMVPVGTMVYNVGSQAQRGAVFCRSAGTYAVVVAKGEKAKEEPPSSSSSGAAGAKNGAEAEAGANENEAVELDDRFVQVRLQSGEVRKVSKDACATIGVSSNQHYKFRQLGKAGRSRWLNIRPTVRGVAMNRAHHPHGGGRGKSKSNRNPVSPWGKPAKGGFKTRRKHNINRWVVIPRVRNMGKRRVKSSGR